MRYKEYITEQLRQVDSQLLLLEQDLESGRENDSEATRTRITLASNKLQAAMARLALEQEG